jgi:transcriptional regulator with XRE-family HTH domain
MQVQTGRLRVVALPEGAGELALSDDEDVPSPGRYIREQRQRRGMSLEQLAAATKIPRASVELLEDDRYDALPGPVFVKGFLRCAARSMGIDPEAVMELLYEQERAALNARKRERAPVPVAEQHGDAVVRRLPPNVQDGGSRRRTPAIVRLASNMPSPAVLLWVIVAAVLAMIVMAAFNLMGTAGGPPPT